MRKHILKLTALLLCAALLAIPAAAVEGDAATLAAPVLMHGTVSHEGSNLILDNTAEGSANGSVVIRISDATLVLDAGTGSPAAPADIKDGDTIYAYVGPAMTLSLPPQTTAALILVNPPSNGAVPVFYQVVSVEKVDNAGITVSTDRGETVTVPSTASISPYLTKNAVTYRDLTPGTRFLAWSENDSISRVLLFASQGLPYTDVTEDSFAYGAISELSAKGIMSGTSATAFSPSAGMTRADVVLALYRLAGSPEMTQSAPSFTDVAKDSAYVDALTWAVGNEIAGGYSDNTFRPTQPVTRQQMAVFIYRWEQHQGGGFVGNWMFLLDYTDRTDISDFAYEGVAWCTMKGVLSGRSDKTLAPKETVTRAAAAVMLQRYMALERVPSTTT